jgi:hypothetical protein
MDASNLGYCIWFKGFLHQGLWDSTTARLHINVLETTASWHFLVYILPKLSKQCNILWRVDNTKALAYVKKEGGTCSPQVLVEAEKALVLRTRCPSACFLSTSPRGKTSWQTQRLVSKRFQTGIFTPLCSGRSRQDGLSPRSTSSPATPPSRPNASTAGTLPTTQKELTLYPRGRTSLSRTPFHRSLFSREL